MNSNLKLGGEHPTVDRVLSLAESNYHDMKERGIWNAPTQVRGLITCWNCNEEGHSAKECALPKNETNIKQNQDKFNQAKANRRGYSRGGGRGGRGRGRDSSGRSGRSGGRGSSTSGRGSSTNEPKDIMKMPPMKKGLTTMNIGGVTHFWCHKCTCWNTDHGTSTHPNDDTTPAVSTTATTAKQSNVTSVSGSFRDTMFQGTRSLN